MGRVSFWLRGQPIGKGRPRFTRQGRAYTPAKTKEYEHRLAAVASDAMIDIKQDPITVPCKLYVLAQFEIPKSWPKKRREAALVGEVFPGKPDIDNIVKIVADALNGVCFEDDAQIIEVMARKKYGDPVVLVTVEWDE